MKLSAKNNELLGHAGLALLLLGILPLALGPYWLNLVGKYLSFSFVAVGIVLAWGYCGILSLGQGVFFGFGGYAMAMFLKLDEPTLREVARLTGGEYHHAGTAEMLRSVYRDLGSRVQVQTRDTELTALEHAAGI